MKSFLIFFALLSTLLFANSIVARKEPDGDWTAGNKDQPIAEVIHEHAQPESEKFESKPNILNYQKVFETKPNILNYQIDFEPKPNILNYQKDFEPKPNILNYQFQFKKSFDYEIKPSGGHSQPEGEKSSA